MYRPHHPQTLIFFHELTISLNKAITKFANFIVMGDFIKDITKEDCSGFDKLEEFCDMFNVANLIKSETCYPNHQISTADLIFYEQTILFSRNPHSETGLNDCHKLISTFMRSFVSRLKPEKYIFFLELFKVW